MTAKLEALRKKIEKIDESIIKLLAQRQTIAKEIGQIKKAEGKKIIDPKREEILANYYHQLSITYGLDPTFVKRIFKSIILASRKVQKT